MAGSSLSIRGLPLLLRTVEKLNHAVKVEVNDEMAAAALEMNAEAVNWIEAYKAQDNGELQKRQQVIPHKKERRYEVVNTAPYAAYVHFGTGPKVKVSAEWKQIADEWRNVKGGDFAEFLARMEEWCKRHGIPESHAYPICINILEEGLEPRPFLENAYNEVLPKLVKRIEQIVRDAI